MDALPVLFCFDMKIRHGKISDKKDFIGTQKESFPKIDIKREANFFLEKIKTKEIFVLEEKGKYAGHISFSNYDHDPLFTDSIVIDEFAIQKKFQNRGYGTALMKKVFGWCKKTKVNIVYLSTADVKGNKAVKYYQKQGFREVGWVKNINPNSECDHNHLIYGVLVKDWKAR